MRSCKKLNDIWLDLNNNFMVVNVAIRQWFSRVSVSLVKIIGKSPHFGNKISLFTTINQAIYHSTLDHCPCIFSTDPCCQYKNKANLRDLIAATGLVISNWIQIVNFFRPCDREIWRMTLQYNRAPLLCYFKLCASFRSHWWIQTSITVRKRPI